jgi:ribosome-binding factor A
MLLLARRLSTSRVLLKRRRGQKDTLRDIRKRQLRKKQSRQEAENAVALGQSHSVDVDDIVELPERNASKFFDNKDENEEEDDEDYFDPFDDGDDDDALSKQSGVQLDSDEEEALEYERFVDEQQREDPVLSQIREEDVFAGEFDEHGNKLDADTRSQLELERFDAAYDRAVAAHRLQQEEVARKRVESERVSKKRAQKERDIERLLGLNTPQFGNDRSKLVFDDDNDDGDLEDDERQEDHDVHDEDDEDEDEEDDDDDDFSANECDSDDDYGYSERQVLSNESLTRQEKARLLSANFDDSFSYTDERVDEDGNVDRIRVSGGKDKASKWQQARKDGDGADEKEEHAEGAVRGESGEMLVGGTFVPSKYRHFFLGEKRHHEWKRSKQEEERYRRAQLRAVQRSDNTSSAKKRWQRDMMDWPFTRRQRRVSVLLEGALVDTLATLTDELPGRIWFGQVLVNKSLRKAKVMWNTSGDAETVAIVSETLAKLAPKIRYEVTQRVRLKYSPELVFERDDGARELRRIEAEQRIEALGYLLEQEEKAEQERRQEEAEAAQKKYVKEESP